MVLMRTYETGLAGRAPRAARLGRQPIHTADDRTLGYEFLYRTRTHGAVPVDQWSARDQDRATRDVLGEVFRTPGPPPLAAGHLAFVNMTRSYLAGDIPLQVGPQWLVLEVVESVPADPAVVRGVRDLRERGYRIAIDDFVALDDQIALLPWADYVKIDCRDLLRYGPGLLDQATRHGAVLVAERVEDDRAMDICTRAGFTLFQGDAVAPTSIWERGSVIPSPRAG
ncbi:hypothetical protein AGMMS50218_14960 [Actinomycetota bacterium]|nr:hypothetical protein AGMMS50218_14960 [Actinomycetota bacterium]